jgi:mRNA interferase YafQ
LKTLKKHWKFKISYSTQFKKDFKKIKNNKKKIEKIFNIIEEIAKGNSLDEKHKAHKIKEAKSYECHVEPDLLLIWVEDKKLNIIQFQRITSHSNLFKK